MCSRRLPSCVGSSTFSGRWNVARMNRPAWRPIRPRSATRSAGAGSKRVAASTTVFPVTAIRSPGIPSSRRFLRACSVGARQRSARWSTAIRLCSSGMFRSKLRSPASTWASGISSALAASAPPSAVFVSPWTTTAAGRRSTKHSSSRSTRSAICCPRVRPPTASITSGGSRCSSSKKICERSWSKC
jgi:hypothetical protein